MEKREDALREALVKNSEETARWENYQKENEQAIENLDMFSKRLRVDVMVPLGRKALTPGQLIHTNEVMVGHYQGYFSKCSSHTAKQICEHRIKMAKEHLEKLKTEAELWQNKLEKPYVDGVLPNAEQREIIEEYDEEKEKRWREEHKLRVKQHKMREREELEKENRAATEAKKENLSEKIEVTKEEKEKADDITRMIEEAEIMEALKQEMDKLEIEGDCDELIQKLMSGEMKLPPPKPRVAHIPKERGGVVDLKPVPGSGQLQGVVKKSEVEISSPPTNNNFRINPELLFPARDEGHESDDSEGSEAPEEVRLIEEQAKFLPTEDQIGFYQYQLQIIERRLLTSSITNSNEIEEKLRLFRVREHLEELLEMAEEAEGAAELAAHEDMIEDDIDNDESQGTPMIQEQKPEIPTKKSRISFALEDQTLEFRKHETVDQMLPKPSPNIPKPKRDIIRLDEPIGGGDIEIAEPQPPVDKKQTILNKVEDNLKFVSETQSAQDFDLVNKIIDNASGMCRTLNIRFKHSSQSGLESGTPSTDEESIPGSPADLYSMVIKPSESQQPKVIYKDAYRGETEVKAPVLKEADRKEAYHDLRTEFSKPLPSNSTDSNKSSSVSMPNAKSILRNKQAVESETHVLDNIENQMNKANTNKKKKKPKKPVKEEESLSAYFKVMHDVVEKPITEPEPLPEGKYIDAHAPKKRVSRFKQMRQGADKT